MSEVVLYDYWRSSASYRLRIALNLAGIDYRTVPVDLVAGDHRAPAHRDRNPQGLVPVLEIDGLVLTQSLAILRYLDRTRGLGLFPEDPATCARVEAAAHAIAVDLHPVCNLSVATAVVDLTGDPDQRAAWMRRFIEPGLAAFDTLLAGFEQTPFCCGAAPGLPDICLLPQMYNARRWGADTSGLTRVATAVAACDAHPAFAAAHPDLAKPALDQP